VRIEIHRTSAMFVLVFIALVLAGCAGAANLLYGRPSLDEVDRLAAEQDFDRALKELERLRRDVPDSSVYVEAEKRVREAGEEWVLSRAAMAAEREEAGDWRGARGILEEAGEAFSACDTLGILIEDFEVRREQAALEVEERLVWSRARALLDQRPHLAELARTRFDDREVLKTWESTEDEIMELHARLMEAAERNLALGQLEAAEEYLAVAARIEPSRVVLVALEQLRRPEAEVPEPEPEPIPVQPPVQQEERPRETAPRPRAAPPPDPRELADRALAAAREALLRGDLRLAQSHAGRAARHAPEDAEITGLRQLIDDRITSQVELLDEAARREYVEGHYEEAEGTWRKALELEPENPQIQQQLERVERVLENLRRLRDRSGEPPPYPAWT